MTASSATRWKRGTPCGIWARSRPRCVGSYLAQKATPGLSDRLEGTFECWVVERFGRRLFEIFFQAYSEKLWGISCRDLDADFAAQRIKKFSLAAAIWSALGLGSGLHTTLVDRFAYPTGGSGLVYERLAASIRERGGRVETRWPVRGFVHDHGVVRGLHFANGETRCFDHVISTMPLTQLVRGLGPLPALVAEAVEQLRFRNTIHVHLNVDTRDLFPDQWHYVRHFSRRGVGIAMETPQSHSLRASQIPHRWTRVDDPAAESVVAAYETVIAGGGPAGLTAAYELTQHGRTCVVLEADARVVGGISRTDQYKGYRFDIGGHRFFSKSDEVNALWREILGDEFLTRSRLSRIYYDRKFFHYPLKPADALLEARAVCVQPGSCSATSRRSSARSGPSGASRTGSSTGSAGVLFEIFFKILHREGLGDADQRHLGRLGGPADQGPEPGRGRHERLSSEASGRARARSSRP